jgi:luciferase family oxidoreductase group 1
MSLKLSVLDQSPIPEGFSAGDALRNSIDLATFADELGYDRYWVAEHHGSKALACASPEVLIGPIAAATSRIRVGSGGVMLPHYSPLKVAENFRMLEGLYPGRIDLGIGRAAGTSPKVAFALQRDKRQPAPDDFRDQLDELIGYFPNEPEISLLGSSPDSVVWAAELGLPYVFADFINANGADIVRPFRNDLKKMSIACWTICADTDAEALRLSYSARMLMTLLFRGRYVPVPTVEHAEEFLRAEGMPLDMLPIGRRIITGSPGRVRAAIEAVAADYCAQEVFIVNILHDHAARRRSYQLIAEAFQ